MSYDEMKESAQRRENAKYEPDVYGFEGEALAEITVALAKAGRTKDATMLVRLGRRVDGSPEAWVQIKVGEKTIGAYNTSFNCPPRPPEDCEQ